MIINTHTHADHNGSNAEFPATVDIVAQENTKANMEKMDAFKGEKAQFLTSGDALVVFPALRVMHAGDLFARKALPIMDTNNGGSGDQDAARQVQGLHDGSRRGGRHGDLRRSEKVTARRS